MLNLTERMVHGRVLGWLGRGRVRCESIVGTVCSFIAVECKMTAQL